MNIVSSANGSVKFDKCVMTYIPALGVEVKAFILPISPSALSLGRLCIEHGCTMLWAGFVPIPQLWDRSRVEVPVHVRHFVPYAAPHGYDHAMLGMPVEAGAGAGPNGIRNHSYKPDRVQITSNLRVLSSSRN